MRFSIPFILLVITLSISHSSFSQQKELYSRVKIMLDRGHTMMDLSALGVAVDHGDYRKRYFISDFSATEIKTVKDAGFKVELLIPDVQKYYREQNNKPAPNSQGKTSSITCDTAQRPTIKTPSHFHLGSYAGFFTYNEMLIMLDSMHTLYPNLISAKQQIDTFNSVEGRPIYWLRVSNNPSVSQPSKPQVLYTAVHHAREPTSLSSTIFYLWYLLENYNSDPQIKAIVDNTELYFIPCINPDGYIYNVVNDPTGGGMWRKNRRNNKNGTFGIDLNRNYGYLWGYDNIGSSNQGSSDTYRGPAAFSEPETKAVKWFCENHNFKLALNYHTFNNELLSPFGHVEVAYPPDSFQYSAFSFNLTSNNFYRYGTCFQCLGYVSNGGSDDWMYGEQTTKNKIFSFTPEIGEVSNGFYPPVFQIIPDCKDNVAANINTAALLLPYAKLRSADPNIIIDKSGFIHYDLQKLSLSNGDTFSVSVLSLNSKLTVPATINTYTGLTSLQNIPDSFSYSLDAGTAHNESIKYVLKLYNGYYDITDTIEFYYSKYSQVIQPDMSSFTHWSNSDWSLNNTYYHTAPASFKSSPGNGKYDNYANAILQLKDTINLTKSKRAYVQFYSRWDIEPKHDYVTVEARSPVSNGWNALCGRYTKPGDYEAPLYTPIYDDHQYDWVLEQMDLSDFLGQKTQLQFTLTTDFDNVYDGFYFDDLKIITVEDSALGIDRSKFPETQISVYPNPAQEVLHIATDGSFEGDGILFDCTGREITHFNTTGKHTTVNIESVAPGMYYIKLYKDQYSLFVQKVQILR